MIRLIHPANKIHFEKGTWLGDRLSGELWWCWLSTCCMMLTSWSGRILHPPQGPTSSFTSLWPHRQGALCWPAEWTIWVSPFASFDCSPFASLVWLQPISLAPSPTPSLASLWLEHRVTTGKQEGTFPFQLKQSNECNLLHLSAADFLPQQWMCVIACFQGYLQNPPVFLLCFSLGGKHDSYCLGFSHGMLSVKFWLAVAAWVIDSLEPHAGAPGKKSSRTIKRK